MRKIFGVLSLMLGGCGLYVPELQNFPEKASVEKFDEAELIGQIKCEIEVGAYRALRDFHPGGSLGGVSVAWLQDWAAKVTLKITVDEKGSANPGVTFTNPLQNAVSYFRTNGNVTSGQSFSTSVGLQASSDATRTETIGFTYTLAHLLEQRASSGIETCKNVGGITVESDLKIDQFIYNKAYIAHVPELVDAKAGSGPFTVFSDQVTFVVIYGASATPVWKLVNITASSTSPLFNVMRTRTHDVTVTLAEVGPQPHPGRPPLLSPDGEAVNTSQLIGQSTATALQSRQP